MYQALYRKYRPQSFDEVVGQNVIIQTLKNSIMNQKINHAYIFTGPRGSGKTSVAKILAKTVNCKNLLEYSCCNKCVCCTQKSNENMDIIEIDAASNNGVDEIREINNKVNLVPTLGKYKVYIIDEVHMLTIGAFNALLKTLEEPPSHIIFILATTDPQKVPITILSRCQRFDFKKINEIEMKNKINLIVNHEQIKITQSAISEIIRISEGSLRDALGILDQSISYTSEEIDLNDIHDINGTITQKELTFILEKLNKNEISEILDKINEYNISGKNIPKITEEIIYLLRSMMLFKLNHDKSIELDEETKEIAKEEQINKILDYIDIFNDSLSNMKKSFDSKMLLELAFIKIYSKNFENSKANINQSENESKQKISQEINTKTKKISQEIIKDPTNNFLELKVKRIENVLSEFSKQITLDIRKKIKNLNDFLLDDQLGQYIEIILDGDIKAASNKGIVFVYKLNNMTDLFNENILNIQYVLKKILNLNSVVIAETKDNWDVIKEKFNNKEVEYEYIVESENSEQVLIENGKKTNNLNNLFGELVEYK